MTNTTGTGDSQYSDSRTVAQVRTLIELWKAGALGGETMPEDAAPSDIGRSPLRLEFFTLPMALNYQRNSYRLWESATAAYADPATTWVFDPSEVVNRSEEELRGALVLHRVALQPNRHPDIWRRICSTLVTRFGGSVRDLLTASEFSVSRLSLLVQHEHKSGFPYLAGPKIFNYWAYVLEGYGAVEWTDRHEISVAPDTHVVQASQRLGVGKPGHRPQDLADAWRQALSGSGLSPIDVHTPLWLWSRSDFAADLGHGT